MASSKLSKRSAWGSDRRGIPIQLYEALTAVDCFDCQLAIPAGSLFSRAMRGPRSNVPICRNCRPFDVLDEPPPAHARSRSFLWPTT